MIPSGPSAFLPVPYKVERARRENGDVWTLTLKPAGNPLPQPSPGQFNMIYAFGVGEIPISLSSSGPGDELVHTVRAAGMVSRAICRTRKGGALGVRGPYGTPWPVEEAEGKDVVIVAGGLGLAPLRPIIHHVMKQRQKYGRVQVLCGTRNPENLIFKREFNRLRGRFDIEVEVTVDHATPEWRGSVGIVTKLISRADYSSADTVAFVCGPEVMMRYAVAELERTGVGQNQVYVSMERNMKCAIGICGRCQFGPSFICKDGPVFRYDKVASLLSLREV